MTEETTTETAESLAQRKGERTRSKILKAARRAFAEIGYERATIRGIAARANVDKMSVIQYFGTKQQLFDEAVLWHIPTADLTADDAGETVENYLRGMFRAWSAEPDTPMAVLLRTSMTSEEAAEKLRERVTAEVVEPIAAAIGAPDARLRAAVVSAILVGIASQRYLLHLRDLAEADTDQILALVTPLIRELVVVRSP